MAKILAIGDVHVKASNIYDILLFKQEILRAIDGIRPDVVVFLGDLHDEFERIHSDSLKTITDLLLEVKAKVSRLVVVIGNHDLVNNSCFLVPAHPFNSFKNFPGITIADKVTILPEYPNLIFCPYVPPKRFVEALNTIENWGNADIIFCHQEFKGAKMGAIVSEHGDEWPVDAPRVVSGHIHDHQWLQNNIYYPGIPFDHSYGANPERLITIINSDDPKANPVVFKLNMPTKLSIKLNAKEASEYEAPENSKIKILVEDAGSKIAAFKKTAAYSKLNKSENIKLILSVNDMSGVKQNVERRSYLEIVKGEVDKQSAEIQGIFKEITDEASY